MTAFGGRVQADLLLAVLDDETDRISDPSELRVSGRWNSTLRTFVGPLFTEPLAVDLARQPVNRVNPDFALRR